MFTLEFSTLKYSIFPLKKSQHKLINLYQFENIFAKLMPNLKEYFNTLKVMNKLMVSKWFQTLFTICLPLDLFVRVWDCIFAKELDFVLNFSFALRKKFEKKICLNLMIFRIFLSIFGI